MSNFRKLNQIQFQGFFKKPKMLLSGRSFFNGKCDVERKHFPCSSSSGGVDPQDQEQDKRLAAIKVAFLILESHILPGCAEERSMSIKEELESLGCAEQGSFKDRAIYNLHFGIEFLRFIKKGLEKEDSHLYPSLEKNKKEFDRFDKPRNNFRKARMRIEDFLTQTKDAETFTVDMISDLLARILVEIGCFASPINKEQVSKFLNIDELREYDNLEIGNLPDGRLLVRRIIAPFHIIRVIREEIVEIENLPYRRILAVERIISFLLFEEIVTNPQKILSGQYFRSFLKNIHKLLSI